jgi:hypothetical protein
VTVYVRDNVTVPASVRSIALNETAESFSSIGVNIDWRVGLPPASSRRVIGVELVTNTRRTNLPGALACAQPYDRSAIQVFYDRIQYAKDPGRVLAHVLVHEITHVLQGIARHSSTGIMKASWDRDDFDRMRYTMLPFTEEDVELIRRGLVIPDTALLERDPSR